MNNFFDILKQYESTNNEYGTDKNSTHSYGDTYNRILEQLKNKDNVNILEIGIYSGAFLEVLSKYIPHAEIYGIDIDLSRIKFGKNIDNIHILKVDGTDPSTPVKIDKKFDLIIDDGSHLEEHQIKSLDIFAPYLKEGGVYIIEDISEQYTTIKEKLQLLSKKHDLDMGWYDLRQIKNRFDDILAIFTKK